MPAMRGRRGIQYLWRCGGTVQEFEIPQHEFADLLTAFRQDQTTHAVRDF